VGLLNDNIAQWGKSPFAELADWAPWELTARSQAIVEQLVAGLGDDYRRLDGAAVHRSAIVENGALLKGAMVIGAHCFIASGSLIRGGCWIDDNCVIGPGAELKSSFVFRGSKLAHFNFVGDSILGAGVNLEAGSVIANYRNELPEPDIILTHNGVPIETHAQKFGALVGDDVRIGANAVIAPGAILPPRTLVSRLTLVDQRPAPRSV
jgi:NDP-sugar pyrophosphorylase family protein